MESVLIPARLDRFEQLDGSIREHTLLVLDLDETLIRPLDPEGSEKTYQARIQDLLKRGMASRAAVRQAYEEFKQAHEKIAVAPSEKKLSRWLRKWRNDGAQILGLTARGLDMEERTHVQLLQLGISFGAFDLPPAHPLPMRRGILFVGPEGNKGSILAQYLPLHRERHPDRFPKEIVFVDDRAENLLSVHQHLRSFPAIAVRLYRFHVPEAPEQES